MSKSAFFKAFLFNLVFWFLLFCLVMASRFFKIGSIAYIEAQIFIPAVRIYGNALLLAVLVSLPYTLMEFVLKNRGVYQYSLLRIMVNRTLIQLAISLVVLSMVAYVNYLYDKDNELVGVESVTEYLFSPTMLMLFLAAMFGNIILSVYRTLQMKIGEEVFTDLLLGSFRPAQEEERAFLFLDLRASTTIAEQLGHETYSFFIQDCFRDLHAAVKASHASVYQYVGDEAVLTWYAQTAVENSNCLRAYFEFESQLHSRSAYYQERYGVVPMFKGGLHLGKVMTAEVGVVKRDIAYHSDVLNTAARIQGLCNEKDARLLVSKDIADLLTRDTRYSITHKGEVLLRGKKQAVEVYGVTQ